MLPQALTAEQARNISLIDVLLEDAGERFPSLSVRAPPEEEAIDWSESRIRAFIQDQLPPRAGTTSAPGRGGTTSAPDGGGTTSAPGGGGTTSAPDGGGTSSAPGGGGTTSAPGGGGTTSAPDGGGTTSAPDGGGAPPPVPAGAAPAASPADESQQPTGAAPAAPLPAVPPAAWAPPAPPAPELFARWFPGLKLSGTARPRPRMRVLALHSSGNAEDMFTAEGTGARRSPSPLLEWCRAEGVELLAAQLPGRGARIREPLLASAQAAAHELLGVAGAVLSDGVPYTLLTHSMGSWVGFELLRAMRRRGLPLPRSWCVSAMPSPDTPLHLRPWRQQHTLGDADFKEELRGWDVNEVVFSDGMWQAYEPILRADFAIFDQYDINHGAEAAPPAASEATGDHPTQVAVAAAAPAPTTATATPATRTRGSGTSATRNATAGARSAGPAAADPPEPAAADPPGPAAADSPEPAAADPPGPAAADPPEPPFSFTMTAFWGTQDRRVKQHLAQGWGRWTSGPFRVVAVEGNHLWPINSPGAKGAWLREVVAAYSAVLPPC